METNLGNTGVEMSIDHRQPAAIASSWTIPNASLRAMDGKRIPGRSEESA
jgi:hypothetical protein